MVPKRRPGFWNQGIPAKSNLWTSFEHSRHFICKHQVAVVICVHNHLTVCKLEFSNLLCSPKTLKKNLSELLFCICHALCRCHNHQGQPISYLRKKQAIASNLNGILTTEIHQSGNFSLQKTINPPLLSSYRSVHLCPLYSFFPTRCGSSALHLKSDSKGKQSHSILIS